MKDPFKIDFSSFGSVSDEPEPENVDQIDANGVRAAKMIKTIPYHRMIRMISDKNIEDLLPWHFEKGAAYHCLSYGGIDAIRERVESKDIEKIDFYVGDIFKGGYRGAYNKTLDTVKLCKWRVAIFHNHCKIICGFGDQFDFVIESSTNLNVNLRLEQTTIYVSRELALWYKEYFDSIHAFNRDFDDWTPWEASDNERK